MEDEIEFFVVEDESDSIAVVKQAKKSYPGGD
jgi:hypothetical protein